MTETCTYPRCKCIVSTSTTNPEPTCPQGLPPAPTPSEPAGKTVAKFPTIPTGYAARRAATDAEKASLRKHRPDIDPHARATLWGDSAGNIYLGRPCRGGTSAETLGRIDLTKAPPKPAPAKS